MNDLTIDELELLVTWFGAESAFCNERFIETAVGSDDLICRIKNELKKREEEPGK